MFHTGADPMERLNNRARFDGPVRKGAEYVLVDDVMTMGGTLAELAHYIQSGGGAVAAVVVLVNAARSGRLMRAARLAAMLEMRHGDAMQKSSRSTPRRSPPRKRSISSASEQLTKSEIAALRQGKRRIDNYAQKHLTGWAAKPAE